MFFSYIFYIKAIAAFFEKLLNCLKQITFQILNNILNYKQHIFIMNKLICTDYVKFNLKITIICQK